MLAGVSERETRGLPHPTIAHIIPHKKEMGKLSKWAAESNLVGDFTVSRDESNTMRECTAYDLRPAVIGVHGTLFDVIVASEFAFPDADRVVIHKGDDVVGVWEPCMNMDSVEGEQ